MPKAVLSINCNAIQEANKDNNLENILANNT